MDEKLKLVSSIFLEPLQEESQEDPEDTKTPAALNKRETWYGGVYNGKKYMYSRHMIENLPLDKLERFIRNQTGIVKKSL